MNIPDKEAWQKSIDEPGFKIRLQIDPELEPFEDEGFSPCVWGTTADDVGFEIYYEPSEDIHNDDEDLIKIISDNDYYISMSWGSSMKDSTAVISYEDEQPDTLEKPISNTQNVIVEAENET
jgi:hypothetical protein